MTSKNKLPYWAYFVSGNMSGVCTRMICQPLDVLKIRLQLQLEAQGQGKYKNLIGAVKTIYKEEGIRAFWKGHMPSQYLSMIYGGVQFGAYEGVNNILTNYHNADIQHIHIKNKSIDAFISGSTAGIIATIVTFPFDLFKTRFVAQKEKIYKNIIHGGQIIFLNEGIKGLYRGLIPTVIQIAPYSGLYFMFYNSLKTFNAKHIPTKDLNKHHAFLNFFNGAASGTIAKIIVYPLDTIKKRFQIQGFTRSSKINFGKVETYSNLLDCLVKMKQHEGMAGFYKGLSPTLLKAGLNTGLMFFFYDLFCDTIRTYSMVR